MNPADYEKLGVFYLGRRWDPDAGEATGEALLYDSRDLTTHAVCVGMTGSGKTGLCVGLLEEAAIDGVPAIAIDPKGDLGNLLLTFPDLAPSDFRPWIDEDAARREGATPEEYAERQATLWKEGLAAWGQDGERIRRLRDAADFAIYTPGSTAGIPLSILHSFDAPPPAVRDDAELLGDRIATAVTGLLGLLGIDADPVRSREHVLLSTILQSTWGAGKGLDLAGLIGAIQQPPVKKVGVLDVDTFFPPKERFELAMRVNAILAAPGFQTWIQGEPLDVGRLLYTAEGKPRVSVISIAHLSDAERMFFVTLLLNEVVGWTRSQAGTSSLRAIVYMDEIFGFFPPVAEPPSKKPLLTMLKQARAFGVGVVLATQNPVDLDYKGLSNAGTWFIGRLQTEQDKARLLDGLAGAAGGGFDRAAAGRLISGLGKRVFLMNDVHETEPALFQTRWAMSYLRGPLTRAEIQRLSAAGTDGDVAGGEPAVAPGVAEVAPGSGGTAPGAAADQPTAGDSAPAAEAPPVLPPEIEQTFVPLRGVATGPVAYEPVVLGIGEFRVEEKKSGVRAAETLVAVAPLADGPLVVDWERARTIDVAPDDLRADPDGPARFADVPAAALEKASWRQWTKAFEEWIYRTRTVSIWKSPSLGIVSEPGEDERDFRIRLRQKARERRDEEKLALERKYGSRIERLQERVRKAEQRVERESDQAREHKLQAAISIGATLLGSVLGRKTASRSTLGKATTAARGIGRSMKQSGDVDRAEETLDESRRKLVELDAEFRAEVEVLEERIDPLGETLETVELRPTRKDVTVRHVSLGWLPTGDELAVG